ncbi:MAG: T9SS type A sorting domain-containing protein [Cryomorphaceae bacterium]
MMKIFTKTGLSVLLLFTTSVSTLCGQSPTAPTNLQINYEITTNIITYDGFSDVSSDGEVVARIRTTNPDGTFTSFNCIQFPCVATPCQFVNATPLSFLQSQVGQPYDQEFDLQFQGMEDDDSDPCTYNPDEDDDYYLAYATWNSGFSTSISQNGGRYPSRWYSNDNGFGGFLLPNSDIWDLQLKTAFRYTHGNSCNDPLTYGVLNFNTSYDHFNSTSQELAGEISTFSPLFYDNTADFSSADVYYSFELTEPTEISISTVNEVNEFTDFDTYLRLFNADCSEIITQNDDVDGTVQSRIVTALDPGLYKIQVEGYQANAGKFFLQIQVGPSTLSVDQIVKEKMISLYPNPTSDLLNIQLDQSLGTDVTILMYDLLGRQVYNKQSQGQSNFQMLVGHLESGTYRVVVTGEKGTSQSAVVIQ